MAANTAPATANVTSLPAQSSKKKLVTRIAERFGVDETKLMETLKSTVFKQRDGTAPTNEQMMALMVVTEQYELNPFTKEIYAFPDKNNGIVPIVGVDGWSRIINSHPEYGGMEFIYSDEMVDMPGAKVKGHVWIECVMYRKSIERPIRVREYLDEVYRPPFQGNGRNGAYTVDGPWQTHTKRFHRHKAMIQCARLAFGFSGIYDQDEAERIAEIDVTAQGSHAFSSAMQSAEQTTPLALSHEEQQTLAPFMETLVARASSTGAWQAAHEWVKGRFQGAHLDYAVQYLRDAEMDAMPSPVRSAQAEVSPEHTPKPTETKPDIADEVNQRQEAPRDMFPGDDDQFPEDNDREPGF